jgi:hypothetical protein
MTYDENGRFKAGGAYDHTGRKVGYDAADMKKGISDVNTEYQDKRYQARENDYLKGHAVSTGSTTGLHHQGTMSDGHLTSTHGGHRGVNDVRTDIRHGLNILKEKHPKGVEGGHSMLTAERLGYEARKHHYVKAEHEAFMKTPAGRTKAANDARAAQPAKSLWDSEPSAPAPRASAPASKPNRTKTRLPNDTLRAGVKEMVKRVLPRKAK